MVKVFTVYAHEDQPLRDELETHLAVLKRQGLISVFHDRRIVSGAEWERVLDEELHTSELIVLLVSPDFLNSDYCVGVEMEVALEMHAKRSAAVVPVIARPCDWLNSPLAKLQAAPEDGKAITLWPNRDEAFLHVAAKIREVVAALPPKPLPLEQVMTWSPTAMVAARSNLLTFGDIPRVPGSVALIVPDVALIGISYGVVAVGTDVSGQSLIGEIATFSIRGGEFGSVDLERRVLDGTEYQTILNDKGTGFAKVYPHEREVWVGVQVGSMPPIWQRTLCAARPES